MLYDSGPASLSMVSIAALLSLGPTLVQAASNVAARSVIGPRTDCASCWRAVRVLLLLDRAHAEHEAGDAIGLVDLQQPLRQPDGFVDLAVLEHRQEGAAQEFGIARIAAQRGAVVDRCRSGIAGDAGVARGQIAARHRNARKCEARLRPGARLRAAPARPRCPTIPAALQAPARPPAGTKTEEITARSTPSGGRRLRRGRIHSGENDLFASAPARTATFSDPQGGTTIESGGVAAS